MPRKKHRKGKHKKHTGPESQPISVEAVEEALAQGSVQKALDLAKLLVKERPGAEAQACLAEAYKERIRQLHRAGLILEAQNLVGVAQIKCPSHRREFETVLAQTFQFPLSREDVSRIVTLLDGKSTDEETFARLSTTLRNGLGDPRYLVECDELPDESPLKKEALFVWEAFEGVAGDVREDARRRWLDRLAQVSRRSPLSLWCLFIRALDSYHCSHHTQARTLLEKIPEHSALAPAAIVLGSKLKRLEKPNGLSSKWTRELWRAMTADSPRSQWLGLINSLRSGDRNSLRDKIGQILQSDWLSSPMVVRAAVRTITQEMMRADVYDKPAMNEMMRAMQRAWGDEAEMMHLLNMNEILAYEYPLDAAEHLEHLQREWSDSLSNEERAMLLARAAEFASEGETEFSVPLPFFRSTQRVNHSDSIRLYEKACQLDPQSEYFEPLVSLMREEERKPAEIERILTQWRHACSNDITPLIYLFEDAENRGSYQKALKFLTEAEEVDPLNPKVREARQRLVWQAAKKHLRQRKFHLVERDLSKVHAAQMTPRKRALFAGLERFLTLLRDEPDPGAGECDPVFAMLLLHHLNYAVQIEKEALLQRVVPLVDLKDGPSLAAYYDLADVLTAVGDALMVPEEWHSQFPEWIARAPHVSEDLLLRISRSIAGGGDPSVAFAATARGLEREGSRLHEFLFYRALILLKIDESPECVEECIRAAIVLCRARGDHELERQATKSLEMLRYAHHVSGLFDFEKSEIKFAEEDVNRVINRERRRTDPMRSADEIVLIESHLQRMLW